MNFWNLQQFSKIFESRMLNDQLLNQDKPLQLEEAFNDTGASTAQLSALRTEIQEIKNMFRFLKYGLSLILVFIGFKMSATYIAHWVGERIGNDQLAHFHLNTFVSLSIIIGVVFGSIILSSLIPEKERLGNN